MINKLISWSGWLAVGAGLLLSAAEVVLTFFASEYAAAGTLADTLSSIFFFSGAVLLVPGVVGLYLRQAEKAGNFGLIAFLAALVGSALMVASDWDELFAAPTLIVSGYTEPTNWMVAGFMLNFAAYAIGWILFAISAYRAGVYHRLTLIMLPLGHLLGLTAIPGTYIFFYVAILLMGLEIIRENKEPQQVPAAAPVALINGPL